MHNFIEELKKELKNRNCNDIDTIISYFEEIITDRIDNGEKEEDIIKTLEDPKTIARTLTKEISLSQFKDVLKNDEDILEEKQEEIYIQDYLFDNVNDVDIEAQTFFINIECYDGDQTKVEIESNTNNKVEVYMDNDRLKVKENFAFSFINWSIFKNNKSNTLSTRGKINIKLPYQKYHDLDIEAVSSGIKLNNINFMEANIEIVSGNTSIFNSEIEELQIENVSGYINIEDLKCDDSLEIESVSGKIKIDNLICEDINIESVSGSIEINILGDIEDYDIDIEKLLNDKHIKGKGKGKLNIESVSGRIKYNFI